jgi:hypothetical protein
MMTCGDSITATPAQCLSGAVAIDGIFEILFVIEPGDGFLNRICLARRTFRPTSKITQPTPTK